MEKYISYEKCSKQERRRRDQQKRGSWNGVNPVTRRSENPKAYSKTLYKKLGYGGMIPHIRAFFYQSMIKFSATTPRASNLAFALRS